ncbi:glycosyltransferase [Candidatus Uhrbacteria bacterium]|nr:glycosyltransferase [Candidatus Uhrbacteria bacterium]
MTILFFANADSVHSHRWIRYFAEHVPECIVHWVSLTPSIDSWFHHRDTVVFYELKKPSWGFPTLSILWYFFRLKKLVTLVKPDIVHAHYAGLNGFVASLLGFHPYILTAWGSDVLMAGKHIIKRYLVAHALRSADLITCDAEHMKRAILSFGIPESRIHIIQFGIDTKRFSPGFCSRETREKLQIPEGYQAVISMRNFDPIYDIETFIRSIPVVLEKFPKTVFLIGGRGPQKEYLSALASELRIEHAIRFLGFIPNAELPQYLRCASLYVSTSLSDAGIASSTAEAMACGTPVIVTDSGENSAWIREGEDGCIIPTRSPKALADKILLLLNDAVLRDRFARNGRRKIIERNDYWTEMNTMGRLYQSLLFKQMV